MQKITILDQSFLDSKKKSILQKKKFLAINFSSFQKKKFLTRVFDPFPIKLFFSGVRHKKTKKNDCRKIVMFSILVKDCSFKKMTASKNQR